jgi:energy-coupling factor transport system ATP-binding protein
LLRALAGLLLTAADGDLTGEVLVDGEPTGQTSARPALLLQDPLAGIVAETVGRDVAFGLENAGVTPAEIWPRVRGALAATGFPYPEGHPTSALSGGESQRMALAGSLVLGSRVLLLDEPTSMLDPEAGATVREAVRRHVDGWRPTTIIVEHHLEPWLDLVERVLVLGKDGRLIADGEPGRVIDQQGECLSRQGVWVPGLPAPDLLEVDSDLVAPWTAAPGAELVRAEAVSLELSHRLLSHRPVGRDAPRRLALSGVDASLHAGRVLAVTGPSGAGKSSLISVLAGLRPPTSGSVLSAPSLGTRRGRQPGRWRSRDLAARLAWVPQSPEQGVVSRTVYDEVLAASRACGRDAGRAAMRAEGLLEVLGLDSLVNASPYHLSGGEQRRLMVAAALANGPFGVLLDEPTVGQDRSTWAAVLGAVASARGAGMGVAIASHDDLAVDVLADDRLMLTQGVAGP